jgi:cell division protein FtsL
MKIRLRSFVIFFLAGLAGAALLYTSQNVQQAEDELGQLQSSVQQEEETIRVLNAEWAYLNSPARLEELATEYLKLKPAQPGKILQEPSVLPDPMPDETAVLLQEVSMAPPEKPEAIPVPGMKPERSPAQKAAQKDFRAMLKDIEKKGVR